jgi:predicted DNA-binding protein (MmcQ/YjbR family)
MKRKPVHRSVARKEKAERLFEVHETLRDVLRELSGLTEKKLWGGLAYRYEDQVFFTMTLRPRTVLVEMKLPIEEAELALGLGFVHPHSFTRLARNGWVAVSISPEISLERVRELIDRSYFSRIESSSKGRRMSRRSLFA